MLTNLMLIHRNRRTDPTAFSLQPEIWHVPHLCLSSKDQSCQEGSGFQQPQFVQEPLMHIPAPALPGNPCGRWLGDSSSVAVFLRDSFRNFQARWNVLTGFSMPTTPILRIPFNLLRSQADRDNFCEAAEQWRARKELKKPLSPFIQKHFHLPITFHRSSFTSWRKYNIAD